jgi:hypothetical protein
MGSGCLRWTSTTGCQNGEVCHEGSCLLPGATCANPLLVDLTSQVEASFDAQSLSLAGADIGWQVNTCSATQLPGGGLHSGGAYNGGDIYYRLTLPANTALDVSTFSAGSGLNIGIFAYDASTNACPVAAGLSCLAASDIGLGAPPDNDEWISVRRCGLGGSQVMVVVAARSPQDVGGGTYGITFRRVGCEDPCAGVPYEGRCFSPTAILYCAAPTGNGTPTLQAYSCPQGEGCAFESGFASCKLLGECRDGEVQCIGATQIRTCTAGAWVTTNCPRECIGSALGDFCSANISTRMHSGNVSYMARRPNADTPTDWSAPVELIAQGFLVLSYHGSDLVDAAVTTVGANGGAFTIRVPSAPDATDRLFVSATAADGTGKLAYVVGDPQFPAAGEQPIGTTGSTPRIWSWSWRTDSIANGSELTITEAMGSGAALIFDYLRYAYAVARAEFQNRSGLSLVAWLGYGTTWTCGACFAPRRTTLFDIPFDSQIWFPADADQSYWADPVTAHELGHWVMSSYGRSPGEGGPHTVGKPTFPGQAWSEGFATWFSSDIRTDPLYYDKQSNSMFWLDLEARSYSGGTPWQRATPSGGLLQMMDENELAAILWQIRSPTTESDELYTALASTRMTHPPFARGYTRHVWELDANRDPINAIDTGESAPCLADFLDALNCAGFSRTIIDAATDPTTSYPYPSSAPLCSP